MMCIANWFFTLKQFPGVSSSNINFKNVILFLVCSRTCASVAHFVFFIYQHKEIDGTSNKRRSNELFEWNSSNKHDVDYTWPRIFGSVVAVSFDDEYQLCYSGMMKKNNNTY